MVPRSFSLVSTISNMRLVEDTVCSVMEKPISAKKASLTKDPCIQEDQSCLGQYPGSNRSQVENIYV